jgi:hypothetical protein
MTTSATQRSVRSLMRHPEQDEPLNILTFTTHERYEYNLCKTGHNFYALNVGVKKWDTDYAEIPENYSIINELPEHVDFDIVLAHTSDDRLQHTHDILSQTKGSFLNKLSIPILRHTHVLPDIRIDTNQQIKSFHSIPANRNCFISDFNRRKWGFDETNSCFIKHGVDTDFWKYDDSQRSNVCLSVVNDWPNRDWCCGFDVWRKTVKDLPVSVWGKSPGFSEPAESTEHLRKIYNSSRIFFNTSLHSPVPTVLLEAMSCGCAIVSTATCMIPEIIQHGYNGLISNDPKELRSFLELLLNNEQLATDLGNNARKTIEKEYNLDIFISEWDKLLYSTVREFK